MKKHTPSESKTTSSDLCGEAEFRLIDPEASPHWSTYLAQRKADKEQVDVKLSCVDEEISWIYKRIKFSVGAAVERTLLGEEEARAVEACVILLKPDFEGFYNVRSAEALGRVYSPTRPSAVDVYFNYYYRTRYEFVEFFCQIYYRVHSKVTKTFDRSVPQSKRKLNGFKRILTMSLADIPPGRRWRAVHERTFDISAFEVTSLHHLLFGEGRGKKELPVEVGASPVTALNDKIGVANMMELLLLVASVGISFTIGGDDGSDSDDDSGFHAGRGGMYFEGIKGSERWLGRNLRRVCGLTQLEGNDQVTGDEAYEDEDEDEDEWGSEEDEGR